MSLIRALDLTLEFGDRKIINGANCSLEKNSRVGLIGSNGSGKTTLIRLFLGQLSPSSGEVLRARNTHIAWLPQVLNLDPALSLIDYARASRPDLSKLSAQIERLAPLADKTPETQAELAKVVETYTALGGYEFDNELKYVLTSLNLPTELWNRSLGGFSGGEQARICLAAILLTPHDLLILDEPTNHLDLEMIRWLENYLLKQDKPFLIVSHDRRFLDNTVNTIWSLRDGQISITKGNYSSFKAADDIARLSQQRQWERQQKQIAETSAYIQKFIAGTRSGSAKSRQKMLDKMEVVAQPIHSKQLKLHIQDSKRSGNDVFTLTDLSFGIPPSLELARNVNLKAHYQDRICVLGPNGCGKTTLLKILLGEHEISSGNLKIGASLEIGYYDQHQINLDPTLSVMDTIWRLIPNAPQGEVLSWLARFGFRGDDTEKNVSVLSGGERSRLFLCQMLHSSPNLMILDEPTNHLDIEMADALLEALKAFQGTVLFVSHDRWFIDKLTHKFWVFEKEPNGEHTTIIDFEGNLDQAAQLSFARPIIEKAAPAPRPQRKKRVNPLHLEQIHQNIEKDYQKLALMNDELKEIHTRLSDSQTYSQPGLLETLQTRMAALENQIAQTEADICEQEDRYLSISYEE